MKTVKNGHKRHIRLDAILLIIGVVCLSIFAGISYYNAMEEKRSRRRFNSFAACGMLELHRG